MKKILVFSFFTTLFASYHPVRTATLTYDIAYVRCPRYGDTTAAKFQDVWNPANLNPGCDLMKLRPDGSEEVLVVGGFGSVADPFVSFDGTEVYYTSYPNLQPSQVGGFPYLAQYPNLGSDIAKVNVNTKVVTMITTHVGAEMNIHPTPLSDGRIMFVSSRMNQVAIKGGGGQRNFQLYAMDADGENVTPVTPMSLSQVMHPFQLKDGRVCFSTQEGQGIRDPRLWGYWCVWPDGRHFEPLISAFDELTSLHFATQLSNGDLVIERYYNLNNQGFGAYLRFPVIGAPLGMQFGDPDPSKNPTLSQTLYPSVPYPMHFPFQPWGTQSDTPFTNGNDTPPPSINSIIQGKVSHPSAAPNNDLLTSWTPNSPAANFTTVAADSGIYIIKGGGPIPDVSQLVLIKNNPNYNEIWPRALVSYKDIYGVDKPSSFPWLPNDGTVNPALPKGTPHGLIGSSNVYLRQSAPYTGTEATNGNAHTVNWLTQGSDAGVYTSAEIDKIRIVTEEPSPYSISNGQPVVSSHAQERLAILGEVSLRKFNQGQPILDPNGNPDTSFLIKIPAHMPFTFQLIDNKGMVLTMAQTWHQVMPGEMHADCGGCHFHNGTPLAFDRTVAGQPGFIPADLTKAAITKAEFIRDIRPILQAKCVSCHKGGDSTAPAQLDLNNQAPVNAYRFIKAIPGDYARFAANFQVPSKWGIPPPPPLTGWYSLQASRYVRQMQSRRSLLIWKLYGARLDGLTNANDPTGPPYEVGTVDHSSILTPAEKLKFVQWIDLGAQVGAEVLDDTLHPTVTISSPRANTNTAVTSFTVGVADSDSGILASSISIKADIAVNGRTAGTELAVFGTFDSNAGIWNWPVSNLTNLTNAHITAVVKDNAGLSTTQTVRFNVGGITPTCTVTAVTGLALKANQSLTDNLTSQKVNVNGTLIWNSQPNAKRYELFIYRLPNGPNTQPEQEVFHVQDLITPGQPITIAAYAGAYKWTIRAGDNASLLVTPCGPWSTGSYSR